VVLPEHFLQLAAALAAKPSIAATGMRARATPVAALQHIHS
jgi:hypothetical protein